MEVNSSRTRRHNNGSIVALAALGLEGSLHPTQLARALSYTSSGTTRVLDRLERHGLVLREHGPVAGDRRSSVVTLTNQEREAIAAIAQAVLAHRPTIEEIHRITGALLEASKDWPAPNVEADRGG